MPPLRVAKTSHPGRNQMIGKTISHYRIVDKLGGGGMGVVYKQDWWADLKRLRRDTTCGHTAAH